MLIDAVPCWPSLRVVRLIALPCPILAEDLLLSESSVKYESLLLWQYLLGKLKVVMAAKEVIHLRVVRVLRQ